MEPVEFLWNESREKLADMQGYIIVGGFSYEDRSRAGIIAALDPVMQEIAIQSAKGKPVLGICNGAQVLVETGLVPGLENNKTGMVLTENKRIAHGKILGTGYYNAWINMRLSDNYQRNAFTRHLTPKHILHVPVAHGEGRFVMTDALLSEVEQQGLNVFQYCDETGNIIDSFPVNPNGSLRNIAAISNKAGNVMAMMPHPERTVNGDAIFLSMRDYIAESRVENAIPLYYYPRKSARPVYQLPAKHHECIVELMITDNHALTVQNTLRQLGFPVTVKRQVHWEVQCDTEATLQQIKKSGVLYNERKEVECSPDKASTLFLVRPREDLTGQQKLQTLKDHFSLDGVQAIHHGVLWQFTADNANIPDLIDNILHTNIISNPYAHECYQYNR
jgi:phosphoribosylformylglycinamidine synthase I